MRPEVVTGGTLLLAASFVAIQESSRRAPADGVELEAARGLRSVSPLSYAKLGVLAVFAFLLVRTAWLGDDAYITFRCVEQLFAGNGPVYNVGQRVQAFTHPLWMMLLCAGRAVTGELYFSSLAISFLLSMVAAIWLATRARTALQLLWVGGLLLGSRAFLDYSSSGLENPLTHVLVLGFAVSALRHFREGGTASAGSVARVAAWVGFCGLDRLDTLVLGLPALAWIAWHNRTARGMRGLLLGLLPVILWLCFALVYYGFPFPNTAYAKVPDFIPLTERLQRGLEYCLDALAADPLTPAYILFGCAVAFLRSRTPIHRLLASGVVLYAASVVYVGGDFMRGRFLTPCAVMSTVLVMDGLPRLGWKLLVPCIASVLLLGALGVLRTPPRHRGFSDERRLYSPTTSLWQRLRTGAEPSHAWIDRAREHRARGRPLAVRLTTGLYGYYAGTTEHVVDLYGLVDPLLARLPLLDLPRNPVTGAFPWRPGHLRRPMPGGYLKTLLDGKNHLRQPDLARYFDALDSIVSGPLFSGERWLNIWRMNTGRYDPLLASYADAMRVRQDARSEQTR